MAYSTDPSNPGAAAFASARITPEEAERLAAMFRPSWELDAPASEPPSTPADADVRGAVHALNGTHAPVPAAVLHEPSVIIEPTFHDADLAAHASRLALAPALPPMRPPVISLDVSAMGRPRTGLWIGLGAAGVVLLGIGLWLVSGSPDKPAAAIHAEPKPQVAASTRIPPPPTVENAATARPAPAPSALAPLLPASTAAASAPPPPPVFPPMATASPPPPRLVVPPAPRQPTWTPPPAAPARPAARPKGNGPTIVRDVPF